MNIEFDVYKQKLNDCRGALEGLADSLNLAGLKNELERLQAMLDTTDGFRIAQEDLKMRGPGDFFGSRQSGLPTFRVASLGSDMETLTIAQQASKDWIERHGADDTPEAKALRERIGTLFQRSEGTMN